MKTTHDDHQICYLDLTIGSKLLSTKINIPQNLKYETIMKPLYEYCFGRSDDDYIWEPLTEEEEEKVKGDNLFDSNNFELLKLMDWKRDETFLMDQLFNLSYGKMTLLAKKLGLWKNRIFVKQVIENYYNRNQLGIFTFLDKSLTNDRDIILKLVQEGFLFELDKSWQNNFEIVKIAVQLSDNVLQYASDELRNDRRIVLTAVKRDGRSLRYASDRLRNDFEIVKIAISQFGLVLQFASIELRNNKEIVLLSLEKNSQPYCYASNEMKLDREVMMKAFAKKAHISTIRQLIRNDRNRLLLVSNYDGNGVMEYCASDELRNDRELAVQSIRNNSLAFRFVSNELKNDREIVKIVACQDGYGLKYASLEFRDDEEIASLALKHSKHAFRCISDRLKNDMEFLSKYMIRRGYYDLPDSLFHDRELVLESIKIDPSIYSNLPNQGDRSVILAMLENCGIALRTVPIEFRNDREIVMAAVSQSGNAIQYVASQYWDDEEILLKASETYYRQSGDEMYTKISERLRNDRKFILQLTKLGMANVFLKKFPRKYQADREIVWQTCQPTKWSNYYILDYASSKLLASDRAFAMRMVKENGIFLQLMCHKHRNDREIVWFAIQQNKEALKYASIELQEDEQFLKSCNLIEEKKSMMRCELQ